MQSFPLIGFTVPTVTTNPNILAGQPIQYMGKAGVLTIYGNADAVGLSMSLSTNDGQENKAIIPNGSGISVASTAGKVSVNEDFIGQFPIPAGVQLMLSVTNPTGAGVNVNFLFSIT